MQKFAGCLALLSRFISRVREKAMPLYQLMKKTDHFVWSQQADDAFNDLKRALSTASVLAAPVLAASVRESQCCCTLQPLHELSAS
jgi:hypothetical protein